MNIRFSITLISTIASLLVAFSIITATHLTGEENSIPYAKASLSGSKKLWSYVLSSHTDQLHPIQKILSHSSKFQRLVELRNSNDITEFIHKNLPKTDILNNAKLVISEMNGNILFPLNMIDSIINIENTNNAGFTRSKEGKLIYAYNHVIVNGSKKIGMISFIFDINYLLKSYIKHNNTDIFIVSSANTIEDSSNPHLYTELNISPPPFGDDSSVVKEINQQFFLITTQTIRSTKKQNLAYLITTENISLNFSTSKSSLWLSFLVGLIIIIITSIIISLFVKRHTKAEQDKINQLISAVHRVNGLDFSVRLDEINDNSKISQFNKSFNTMVTTFDSITCDTQVQLSEMTSIIGDIRGKSEFIQDVIGLASQGDLTGEMMIFSGGETIDQVANSIATMLENLNELIGKVKQSGAQVTSSATEIAATAKQQEATVTEQAATVNKIMSTVQDISSTSKDLVDTMHEVAEVAESTAEGAAQSQSSLLNMETSMHQMMDATESIGSKLSVINEKASNINTVVTTITKVADQTNLLSLNAAIEAEKAGEYGAGFSVVATEIRRLADQTAVATWDIEQMVKEMQAAVSAGVMGMDKFSDEVRAGVQNVADVGSQLADIIDRVQTLIPRFDSVHEGMQSQSLAAEQISESMVQLNESAQQTADSLIHSNDAIMQLNYAAHILQDAVSRFTLKD